MSIKNSNETEAGIEPATLRFVTQRINHRATVVPNTITIIVSTHGQELRYQEAFLGFSQYENTISNMLARITPRPLNSVTTLITLITLPFHAMCCTLLTWGSRHNSLFCLLNNHLNQRTKILQRSSF